MEKYRFFFTFYHFDSDPRFPPFLLYMLGGNLGSLLYGDVSVMFQVKYCDIFLVFAQSIDFGYTLYKRENKFTTPLY